MTIEIFPPHAGEGQDFRHVPLRHHPQGYVLRHAQHRAHDPPHRPRFIAPGIGLGLQLLLHFAYGREYVLYSGNWHGVLSAVIVALGWRAFGRHELKLAAVTLPIIVALAANSAIVIERVYYEVAGGMGQADRDETGALPGDH